MQNVKQIRQRINSIDKDKNGNITNSEFEDILKLENPQLTGFDLKSAMKAFSYNSNKLLVDYNKFFYYAQTTL